MKKNWPRANWRNSVRLRDVVILIALPAFVGFYLIAASILDYSKIHQFDDPWSRPAKLNTYFVGRISAALDLPKMLALQRRLDPEKNDQGIVRLSIAPELWSAWQSEPLALVDEWNDATLVRGNRWSTVKLRKRGDNSVHWTSEKKSFTLKTPRSSLFKGHRTLVFSAKTVLGQYVVNRLASEFDLMAPFTTVAPVFVNERFYGIFRVSELIDESFLRRHGRMPGNIFRGDAAERGEVFKGVHRGLAVNPYIWDRVAMDHRPVADAESTLQAFLRDVNGTTFDDHLRLMSWVDLDEVARLVAFMLIVGDPFHLSDVNNNFWYEDPSSGLLHPIPWDLRLTVLEKAQDSHDKVNPILTALLRNPFVLDRALHVAQQKDSEDRLSKTAEQIISSVYERYQEHFEYDRLREPFTPIVGDPHTALAELRSNFRLLNAWFQDSLVAFHATGQAAGGIVLDFEARGHAGSDLHAIVVEGDVRTADSVRLTADGNRNGILDPSDQEVPGEWTVLQSGGQLVLTKPPALLPGVDADKPGFKAAPIHYRFFLNVAGPHGKIPQISRISADLRNRLTGKLSKIIEWNGGDPIRATPSWHPWQYPVTASPVEHRIEGDTRLHKTLIIPKGDTLIIEAGATINMDRDVSIISHGRALVRGTSERPITFRATAEGEPWGTFALQGEGASGSELNDVRFSSGGGAFVGRVEYKGMITIHRAKLVSLRNCRLSDNVRSDDALNAVHANLTIENCIFRLANSDAIDFDYSSGKIANCRFEASGNDAIDLMGSAPQLINNYITGSGDKGISIGEGSHPFVFNNYITDSNKGIEVKDGSEPFLVHNAITQNKIGLLQSAKNWRYGSGGWGKLVNSEVLNNGTDFERDKDSRLTRVNSGLAAPRSMPVNAKRDPSDSIEPVWVLAHHGIRPTASNSAGRLEGWTAVKPTAPEVLATFADDFEQPSDGWVAHGGVSELVKRGLDLQATFSRGQGSISKNVDWNLTESACNYVAVLELAGLNLRSGSVSVTSADSEVTRPFPVPGDLASYAFLSMELKHGRYTKINIAADPGASTGRVHLHSYRLYAIPQDVQAASTEDSIGVQGTTD